MGISVRRVKGKRWLIGSMRAILTEASPGHLMLTHRFEDK
jgi:hypothetical protein